MLMQWTCTKRSSQLMLFVASIEVTYPRKICSLKNQMFIFLILVLPKQELIFLSNSSEPENEKRHNHNHPTYRRQKLNLFLNAQAQFSQRGIWIKNKPILKADKGRAYGWSTSQPCCSWALTRTSRIRNAKTPHNNKDY